MIDTGTPSNHATPYFISSSSYGQFRDHVCATCIPRENGIDLAMTTAEVPMRAFNHHMGSPSMALVTETVDLATGFKHAAAWLRRKARHSLCTVFNGGHELYRARTDTKLYQQCLLCGYETHGWTIDRRDRRLHLVGHNPKAIAASRR
jgi:hypothetical protein